MKRLLIACFSIFTMIGCKNYDVDSDLTAQYVGVWETPSPINDTEQTWTIEKTGKNQLKISILEHTEFNFEPYVSETNKTYLIEDVKVSNDSNPSFHFEKKIDDKNYEIGVSLSVDKNKLNAELSSTQKESGTTLGGNLDFVKK